MRTLFSALIIGILSSAVFTEETGFKVPDTDPEITTTVKLVDAVAGKHPRLLFTAEDIPRMKELARGEGAGFMQRIENQLKKCIVPSLEETKFNKDDTDGQRQGLWRSPNAGLHWVLTGDKKSFETALGYMKLFLATEHWQLGRELNSGMGAGNIMAGAALLYDWLYHELDPDFREAYRKKLLLQARRMYYHGHLKHTGKITYWQSDPANNHRWHRNAGMGLAVLAVAGDGPGYEWILEKTAEEIAYIGKWLPHDGSTHESPSYMVFGLTHLCLFMDAADRCLGTSYFKLPFFASVPLFRLYTTTPGMTKTFAYGDSGEKAYGGYHNAFFRCTAASGDKDAQEGLVRLMKKHPKAFDFGWFSMIWYDTSLSGGNLENLARNHIFGDVGVALMRDGWNEENVGMMHKCGPYGGYDLNKFRNTHDMQWINVAHDDPDANEVIIYAKKMVFAKPDGYSAHKHTAAHNTILVNGKGQAGSDSSTWSQPIKDVDMTTLSYITTWKENKDGLVISEGEAGNAYKGIDRFRRATVWVPGKYILLIDDITARKENKVEWLMQGAAVEIVNQKKGLYRFTEGGAALDFKVSSVQKTSAKVIDSPAEYKKKLLGYKQIRLESTGKTWGLASVFNAWDVKGLSVSCKETKTGLKVSVTGKGFTDEWIYERAAEIETPSKITGTRKGNALISCGPADKAPRK